MFKNIIPGLISFDTEMNSIRGSYFFQNLNFYPSISKPAKYHYKISIVNSIDIPDTYDIRNGYYFIQHDTWYYQRKLFFLNLKFSYNVSNKTFCFSPHYRFIPFEIGGILPIGRHIADIVNLDIFLAGYTLLRGFAYEFDKKTNCVLAPSFNGKTTIMKQIMNNGGHYVAEDILLIDLKNQKIYPTPIITQNYGRTVNAELAESTHNQTVKDPRDVDRIIGIINSTRTDYQDGSKFLKDYLALNAPIFLNNLWIKSVIFQSHLEDSIQKQVKSQSKMAVSFEYMHIKDFHYDALLFEGINRQHWENLGSNYQKVWRSFAKGSMNKQELSFINKYLEQTQGRKILDVGFGNGRIIQNYLQKEHAREIYGIDIATEMVEYAKNKFLGNTKVKQLQTCDISSENIPYKNKFDFISSIRVIKYNENWKEIAQKIVDSLSPGGIFVFDMPNSNSLNKFAKYPIPFYKSNTKELCELCEDLNVDLLEMTSFTRLPDKAYELSNNRLYSTLLMTIEKLLSKIFRQTTYGRILFLAVRKK